MKVLVSGGTGFVGRAVARRLQKAGHRVRLFARDSTRAAALRAEGFELSLGDVRDAQAVSRAVSGCNAVVHMIAAYRQEGVPINYFRSVNAEGTKHMLDACIASAVSRIVHCSTTGVYGRVFDPPNDEDRPYRPVDHYQRTKAEGEQLARRAFDGPLAGRGVVVRPTGVYGPDDTRFLKILRPLSKGRFIIPGNGRVLYHPSYVDDVARGFELALVHPAAPGRTYHIAGPRYYTVNEYVGILCKVLGVKPPTLHFPLLPLQAIATVTELGCRALRVEPPIFRRRLAFFRDHRAFLIERARDEIGYDPKIELAEGMRRTVEWSQQHGLLQ